MLLLRKIGIAICFLVSFGWVCAREVGLLFKNSYHRNLTIKYTACDGDSLRQVTINSNSTAAVFIVIPDEQLFDLSLGIVRIEGLPSVISFVHEAVVESVVGEYETLFIQIDKGAEGFVFSYRPNIIVVSGVWNARVLPGQPYRIICPRMVKIKEARRSSLAVSSPDEGVLLALPPQCCLRKSVAEALVAEGELCVDGVAAALLQHANTK